MGVKTDIKYAAHIKDSHEIHWLEDHLTKVASMSAAFATAFRSDQWAELAGRWHDLGKYSAAFQKMIFEANGMEAHIEPEIAGPRNHSSAGALYAVEKLKTHGHVLAYLIAGHHSGLPDWYKIDAPGQALGERLTEKFHLEAALKANIPDEILEGDVPLQPFIGGSAGFALWLRMLFSALVDADFLDTESFYDQGRSDLRGGYPDMADLKLSFDNHMRSMEGKADQTTVNRVRADILADCRRAGQQAEGIFSLTVPTGGGKTLSSMAFALEHAIEHGKDRIIYAIPYTSIIEQTANIFRNIFGDSVIEHHSSLDPDREDHKSRLAAENWDAPIVVTTNVQFFESLFSARASRCRKLHNIAGSIVILDEAQLMPPEFLSPILKVMNLLVTHYGVTFVISTATQPALGTMKDSFGRERIKGLDKVREIIPNPDDIYRQLERVRVRMPVDFQRSRGWEDMADEIAGHESVLAIVNTRKDARELYRLLPEGAIHLSALMCGEHRSQVIADIKGRLGAGRPTRVVSTQLVEAGVDLDFPVVYRAMAGLDSIAQAAGRCNREGRITEKGKVVVFVPPKPAPAGHLLRAAQTTVSLMGGYEGDPLARENFKHFFENFYDKCDLDKDGIEALLRPAGDLSDVQFRTAAMRMRLIKDAGIAVLVPMDEKSESWIGLVKRKGPERWLMRKLQRYTVSLSQFWFDKMRDVGDVIEVQSGIYALASPALYHEEFGLLLEGEPMAAEQTIW